MASNNKRTAILTISLLPEILAGLDRIAAEEGRSRSGQLAWLIRGAIKEKTLKKRLPRS